jgi:hypothetical protein
MGLFSTLGKIVGSVVSLVPGVGSIVGGIIAKGGELLDAKKSMNHIQPLPVAVRDASRMITGMGVSGMGSFAMPILRSSTAIMRGSPVLPGGAVATPMGPQAQHTGAPARSFGRKGAQKRSHAKRARRGAKRASTRVSHRTGAARTRGRKLKFGSAAYRKKYLRHRR